jgi:hypothetical protein
MKKKTIERMGTTQNTEKVLETDGGDREEENVVFHEELLMNLRVWEKEAVKGDSERTMRRTKDHRSICQGV